MLAIGWVLGAWSRLNMANSKTGHGWTGEKGNIWDAITDQCRQHPDELFPAAVFNAWTNMAQKGQ